MTRSKFLFLCILLVSVVPSLHSFVIGQAVVVWKASGSADTDGDGVIDRAVENRGADTNGDGKADIVDRVTKIDLNKDGDFDDPGETTRTSNPVTGNAKASGDVTDPQTGINVAISAEDTDGNGTLDKVTRTVKDKDGRVLLNDTITKNSIRMERSSRLAHPLHGCTKTPPLDEKTTITVTDSNGNGKLDEGDRVTGKKEYDESGDGVPDLAVEMVASKLLKAYKVGGYIGVRLTGISAKEHYSFISEVIPNFCLVAEDYVDLLTVVLSSFGVDELIATFDPLQLTVTNEVSNTVPIVVPQIGNGQGVTSTLIIDNASLRERASGVVKFFDDNGQPLTLGIVGQGAKNSVSFEVEPGGKVEIATDGQGPLVAGSAQIITGESVGAVVRFNIPGRGIAGVGTRTGLRRFIVPVRKVGGIITGLALTNTTASTVTMDLILKDRRGTQTATARRTLVGGGHFAAFLDQFFGGVPDGFEGTLTVLVSGDGAVAAEALELGKNAGEFTALPVTPID